MIKGIYIFFFFKQKTAYEISCWNGDLVRLAFIIDAHDREIIAWHAVANAGISGSMVRDMMLEAVESRFAAIQAPHALEWLSDNGSVYTAHETRAFATALNLIPCFTPIQSPESNGISESFVKTFQARLCSREPSSGCVHRTPADRRMVLGLQRKPSPFCPVNMTDETCEVLRVTSYGKGYHRAS